MDRCAIAMLVGLAATPASAGSFAPARNCAEPDPAPECAVLIAPADTGGFAGLGTAGAIAGSALAAAALAAIFAGDDGENGASTGVPATVSGAPDGAR